MQTCSLDRSGNYGETTGSSEYEGTNHSSSRSMLWSNEKDEMDYLMDHCIEIDSNRRMEEQFIKGVRLTFKEPQYEADVRAISTFHSVSAIIQYGRIFRKQK